MDISILATVAASDVRTFYVEDDPLYDLGQRYGAKIDVIVKRLPDPPKVQGDLLGE